MKRKRATCVDRGGLTDDRKQGGEGLMGNRVSDWI